MVGAVNGVAVGTR